MLAVLGDTRYVQSVGFDEQIDDSDGDMLRREVSDQCVIVVGVLKNGHGNVDDVQIRIDRRRRCYRHPLAQRVEIVKKVLVRMIELKMEAENANQEQFAIDDGIAQTMVFVGDTQMRAVGMQRPAQRSEFDASSPAVSSMQ